MENRDIPQTVTLTVVGDGNREKRYEDLTFADDFMFGKVMSNKDNCKRLLEILLNIDPDTELAAPISQNAIRVSPNAKSIIVDVRTHDALNDYDLEAQKIPRPDLPKRARYYQAMMDIDYLEAGHDYVELKNNYIIFICLRDLFKKGLPVYTFQNRCVEDPSIFLGDKTTKIFLNASKCDKIENKELKAFMEYVKTGETSSPYTITIDKLVTEAKTNPLWKREYMDILQAELLQQRQEREAIERGLQQGIQQGIQEGAHNRAVEDARRMLAEGLSIAQTARIAQIPEDEVRALQSK